MKFEELKALYDLPLFDLIKKSREVHDANWKDNEIQLCTLLSIKTGGCSEDCSYCAQSARYKSGVESEKLMEKEAVMERARVAAASGSTRFCMGAAWKGVRSGTKRFDQVVEIIEDVSELGMEVCVTLGEVGPAEAVRLKKAGVTAYNHNVDTSREHYPNVVTSHSYDDRLQTIKNVQDAGMAVCCGGILGLGETADDRLKMIETISELNPQPESVPINSLMPMPGTPLGDSDPVTIFDVIRMIAISRIAVPKAKVRLSAGRTQISEEGQAMCFFAGANSIFYGDKLLTAKNPSVQKDLDLIDKLGLSTRKPDPNMEIPKATCDKEASPCCG
ncbi:MAG: biotin synthase BioB [Rubritalea sp.]|uniref:biotin synthase BioB n=1 Tax=Rubritalea sp. TaxID=2109375 RepID=UPI003242B34D